MNGKEKNNGEEQEPYRGAPTPYDEVEKLKEFFREVLAVLKSQHIPVDQWLIAISTFGLLIAAIVAGVIYGHQLGAMKRTLRETQQQTCIQREASINAERAWIGLANTPQVEITSLQQKQFLANIHIEIENFGKGPAFNVYSLSRFATHGHIQDVIETNCNLIFPFVGLHPFPANLGLSTTQTGSLIFPGQPPISAGTSTEGNSTDILGQEVFVVGCIVYRDQFQRPHWTKFSYSTGPLVSQVVRDSSAFRHLYISTGNNSTDDAQKPQPCSVSGTE